MALSHRPFAGETRSLSATEHAARCLIPETPAQKQQRNRDNNNDGTNRQKQRGRKMTDTATNPAPTTPATAPAPGAPAPTMSALEHTMMKTFVEALQRLPTDVNTIAASATVQASATADVAANAAATKEAVDRLTAAIKEASDSDYGEFALQAAILAGITVGAVAAYEGAKYGLGKWLG